MQVHLHNMCTTIYAKFLWTMSNPTLIITLYMKLLYSLSVYLYATYVNMYNIILINNNKFYTVCTSVRLIAV